MAVNSMDYSGKDTVLDVIRTERARFYTIIDDPNNWNTQTRCEEWEVRDIVGHMIDVTEGYLSRWDMARVEKPANALGPKTIPGSIGPPVRPQCHGPVLRP